MCSACARPTDSDERSLVRGEGEYNQGFCVYFAKRGVGVGCKRVLMKWFVFMWRVALSLTHTEARPSGTPLTGTLQPK